jgi:hypothetical protein
MSLKIIIEEYLKNNELILESNRYYLKINSMVYIIMKSFLIGYISLLRLGFYIFFQIQIPTSNIYLTIVKIIKKRMKIRFKRKIEIN